MTARVLLIGGAPLSGKSRVARVLAARHDRALVATDDLGAAARALTTPASHPALHPMHGQDYRDYYLSRSVDELWREARAAHQALAPAIAAVATQHASWGTPAIVEGWAILPEHVPRTPNVHAVWLLAGRDLLRARLDADVDFWRGAGDEAQLRARFTERSLRLEAHLAQTAGAAIVTVRLDETPDALADRIEALLPQAPRAT